MGRDLGVGFAWAYWKKGLENTHADRDTKSLTPSFSSVFTPGSDSHH